MFETLDTVGYAFEISWYMGLPLWFASFLSITDVPGVIWLSLVVSDYPDGKLVQDTAMPLPR
jgi:hypothetical protein